MNIFGTVTQPLAVVLGVITLAAVQTDHTGTVHLGTVLALVALRTATVVATFVVQAGGVILTGALCLTFIIVYPTVWACVSSSIAHTVTVVTARGVHTLAPLTGLMLALIDVHLTRRPIPTFRTVTDMATHQVYTHSTVLTGVGTAVINVLTTVLPSVPWFTGTNKCVSCVIVGAVSTILTGEITAEVFWFITEGPCVLTGAQTTKGRLSACSRLTCSVVFTWIVTAGLSYRCFTGISDEVTGTVAGC